VSEPLLTLVHDPSGGTAVLTSGDAVPRWAERELAVLRLVEERLA